MTSIEPDQRPPRYDSRDTGLVNSSWKVSRWKSRRIEVPKIAAITIMPNMHAPNML